MHLLSALIVLLLAFALLRALMPNRPITPYVLLVAGDHRVGHGQPGTHAVVDHVRHIVKGVEQIGRPDHATQVHVPADQLLRDQHPVTGGLYRGRPVALAGCHPLRRRRVQAPLDVFDPGILVLDRMVDIFRHEAVTPPFEE